MHNAQRFPRMATLVLTLSACSPSPSNQKHPVDQPPAPGTDECCDYQSGGTSRIHTYTCCNPHFGSCGDTTFQGGATTNSYCTDGAPTGGGTLTGCYSMPTHCDETMCNAATACQSYCSGFALNRAICWNWTTCFSGCMSNQVMYASCTRPSAPSGFFEVALDGGTTCSSSSCSGSASCASGDCTDPTCSDAGAAFDEAFGPLAASNCSCPDGYDLVSP